MPEVPRRSTADQPDMSDRFRFGPGQLFLLTLACAAMLALLRVPRVQNLLNMLPLIKGRSGYLAMAIVCCYCMLLAGYLVLRAPQLWHRQVQFHRRRRELHEERRALWKQIGQEIERQKKSDQ